MTSKSSKSSRGARLRSAVGSLTSHAYKRIRCAILSGDLALGSPISGRKVAGQLKMSLLPVARLVAIEMSTRGGSDIAA